MKMSTIWVNVTSVSPPNDGQVVVTASNDNGESVVYQDLGVDSPVVGDRIALRIRG